MQIKRGGGGFTLAELLIVMAIITVLAAIAIPTFGKQLETARESNDAEAIRAAATDAYSKVYMNYATTGSSEDDDLKDTVSVVLTQQTAGFQYITPVITIGSQKVTLDTNTELSSSNYTKNSAADVEFTFVEDTTNNGLMISQITIGGGTAVTATAVSSDTSSSGGTGGGGTGGGGTGGGGTGG